MRSDFFEDFVVDCKREGGPIAPYRVVVVAGLLFVRNFSSFPTFSPKILFLVLFVFYFFHCSLIFSYIIEFFALFYLLCIFFFKFFHSIN